MKFVFSILVHGLVSLGFACLGSYLIVMLHPLAGGWLIAGGIISLVCTNIHVDDKKKEEENGSVV